MKRLVSACVADRLEADGPEPADLRDIDDLPPQIALAVARTTADALRAERETAAAVFRARQAGMSWHKIGLPLHLTVEGARRAYKTTA